MAKTYTCIITLLLLFSLNSMGRNLPPSMPGSTWFVENAGQVTDTDGKFAASVLYTIEQPGVTIYLTTTGLTYVFLQSLAEGEEMRKMEIQPEEREPEKQEFVYERFDLELAGGSIAKAKIIRTGETPHYYNYYNGSDGSSATGKHAYTRLTIPDVYPGIDWVLYADEKKFNLKYDFVVHPGADPEQIRLLYRGKTPLTFSDPKTLVIRTVLGNLSDHIPLAYSGKPANTVPVSYRVHAEKLQQQGGASWYETTFGFRLGSYARSQKLVIDPAQLTWGTYFGGNNLCKAHIFRVDYDYDLLVAGLTTSLGFPFLNPGNNAYFRDTIVANQESFIAKFDSAHVLKWCTYYEGENIFGMEITPSNDVVLCGNSGQSNLAMVNPGGGAFFQPLFGGSSDGLILRFSDNGVLEWSTYFGTAAMEKIYDMEIAPSGEIYMCGFTTSGGNPMPLTGPPGSYQQLPVSGDAFMMRFTPAGVLDWFTYFGGNFSEAGCGIKLDSQGQVYVAGTTTSLNLPVLSASYPNDYYQPAFGGMQDFFLLRFTPGLALDWSTYLGGSGNELNPALQVDHDDRVYITGNGVSPNFPLVNPGGGAYYTPTSGGNIVLACFSDSLEMEWSTRLDNMLGNQVSPGRMGMALSPCDDLLITSTHYGSTSMLLNPGNGAYYIGTHQGGIDVFIAEFNRSHQLTWGTYFGGSGTDDGMIIGTDESGNFYVGGDGGGLGYMSSPDYATFQSNCHLNPGNGAYYQSLPNLVNMDYNYIAAFKLFNAIAPPNIVVTDPSCPNYNDGTIVLTSPGAQTIEWQPSGSTAFSLSGLSSGSYQYILTNSAGCKSSGVVTLIQGQLYDIQVVASDLYLCEGDSSTLVATGAPLVTWNPPAGNGNTITVVPQTTTTYVATYTDSTGCVNSDSVTIYVTAAPVATISCPDTICSGDTAMVIASGGLTNNWLNAPTTPNPLTYVFTSDTTFMAVASNGAGCPPDTATVFVNVIGCLDGIAEQLSPGFQYGPIRLLFL